jgi:UDP-2,4-diacetamido-2,4,6-trideoxy-beta-L-altropyranose hydrolase
LTSIVFRADASPEIGAGHVMRCLALAKVLSGFDCESVFAVSPETPATVPALGRAGHEIQIVDAAAENPVETLARRFVDAVDWLVIDHYGIDANSESAFRNLAQNIMVIDDLADRSHDCDLLLDQGPGRSPEDYAGLVPAHAYVLAGPGYALLDPAYGDFSDRNLAGVPDKPAAIFVSFGATDPRNFTVRGLDALEGSAVAGPVNVVLGAAAPHREEVSTRLKSWGSEATLHIDTPEVIPLLADSFLAIGAGGVSALERCCCGVPSVIAMTADNQRAAATGMRAAGAAQLIDLDDITGASNAIADFAGQPDKLARIAVAGKLLCDGRGGRRVAMALVPERSANGAPVRLRPAAAEDEYSILEWQRSPGVRRFARNPDVPDAATHAAWMKATLNDPEVLLNIIECDHRAAGVLRFDRRPDRGSLPAFEVSILLAPDHHRAGIGRAGLALARRLAPGAVLLAAIHRDNTPSLSLFHGAGYIADGAEFASWPAGAPHVALATQGERHG